MRKKLRDWEKEGDDVERPKRGKKRKREDWEKEGDRERKRE
jgi:hypothetical protein